jgi:hypothetical protein
MLSYQWYNCRYRYARTRRACGLCDPTPAIANRSAAAITAAPAVPFCGRCIGRMDRDTGMCRPERASAGGLWLRLRLLLWPTLVAVGAYRAINAVWGVVARTAGM